MAKKKTFSGEGLMAGFLDTAEKNEVPELNKESKPEKPRQVNENKKTVSQKSVVSPVRSMIPVISLQKKNERLEEAEKKLWLNDFEDYTDIENLISPALKHKILDRKYHFTIRLELELFEKLQIIVKEQRSRIGPYLRVILETPGIVDPYLKKKSESVRRAQAISERRGFLLYTKKDIFYKLTQAAKVQDASVTLVCNDIFKRYLEKQEKTPEKN